MVRCADCYPRGAGLATGQAQARQIQCSLLRSASTPPAEYVAVYRFGGVLRGRPTPTIATSAPVLHGASGSAE